MRTNNHRGERVNSDVQRVLSHIIGSELKDPRISLMTSIVKCEVTKDLKECKAYVSVMADEESQKDTIKGLNSAKGYIRKCLASSLNLRNTPDLHFVLDHSIQYGVDMSHKIDEIMAPIREKDQMENEEISADEMTDDTSEAEEE